MLPISSTYRMQLSAAWTIRQATEVLPYLHRLGISHLYTSPLLAAVAGSSHGYDVIDPQQLNPELGTEEDLSQLVSALRNLDMGLVIDIVPNHMATNSQNKYWQDVLLSGRTSPFASWFDIEWRMSRDKREQIVLPVLGQPLEKVLEAHELSIEEVQGQLSLAYFENRYPLRADTVPESFRSTTELNPRMLQSVLDQQAYQLVYWRTGSKRLNYRRFFDVNELVGIRVEDENVFQAVHLKIGEWLKKGYLDGLRIDHIDGLARPGSYLRRLVQFVDEQTYGEKIPLFVEKILAADEKLPRSWPVAGTTGYDYLARSDDLYVDAEGYDQLRHRYHSFTKLRTSFEKVVQQSKRKALVSLLSADLRRVVETYRQGRIPLLSVSPAELMAGIVEMISALPVYRTYFAEDPDSAETVQTSAEDRKIIEDAHARARAIRPGRSRALDVMKGVFLSPAVGIFRSADARTKFIRRFQQLSGPATAKGLEDTAFYRYVPLLSRNEVGSSPGTSLDNAFEAYHAANAFRAQNYPDALLALSTHDTKRSADARVRLALLTDIPHQWSSAIKRWHQMNRAYRVRLKHHLVPDQNLEWHLYQALLALVPNSVSKLPYSALTELTERLERYAIKAVREAKLRTSWTQPDAEYEAAVAQFVRQLLSNENAIFLRDFQQFLLPLISRSAAMSLSQVALQFMAPGVPDTYQGNEIPQYTLVDPDNRSSVDFEALSHMLAAASNGEILTAFEQGKYDEAKMAWTEKLLTFRRAHRDLFQHGRYIQLFEGNSQYIAFARTAIDRAVIVIAAARRTSSLGLAEFPLSGVDLPQGTYQGLLHGGVIDLKEDTPVRLPDTFQLIPCEVFVTPPLSLA